MNRAEAIEFAKEQQEIFGGKMGEFLKFVEDALTQTNTSNTLNALATRWIPVTERLPKPVASSQKRAWFITSNQYGGVTLTCYEFEASPFKEGWQTDMTILAWMPLPAPWKGENDG